MPAPGQVDCILQVLAPSSRVNRGPQLPPLAPGTWGLRTCFRCLLVHIFYIPVGFLGQGSDLSAWSTISPSPAHPNGLPWPMVNVGAAIAHTQAWDTTRARYHGSDPPRNVAECHLSYRIQLQIALRAQFPGSIIDVQPTPQLGHPCVGVGAICP
jgi:hypothetical protein